MGEILNITLSIPVDDDIEKEAVMQTLFDGSASQVIKRFALGNLYTDDLKSQISNIEAYSYHLYNTLVSLYNIIDSQGTSIKDVYDKLTLLEGKSFIQDARLEDSTYTPKDKPKPISKKKDKPKTEVTSIEEVVVEKPSGEPPKSKGLIFGRKRMKRS